MNNDYVLGQNLETINILYVNEENNQLADTVINACFHYISTLEEEVIGPDIKFERLVVNFTDTKTMVASLCSTYTKLLDEHTPPHAVLDMTMSRQASETVKSFTEALALPTIAGSFAQDGDLILWRNLTDEQKNYLIQIMPPADIIPQIIRTIIQRQSYKGDVGPTHYDARIRNAAILFDDSFVMDHKHKSLLQNIPTRHVIQQIEEPSKMKDQLKRLHNLEMDNFFVLGSLVSIQNVLHTAYEMKLLEKTFVWYVITQDEGDLKLNCKNITIIYIKPISNRRSLDRLRVLMSEFHLNGQSEIAAAFYYDLTMGLFLTIKNMVVNNLWPNNLTYISCDDYDGQNTPSRDGLNLTGALKRVLKVFEVYGPINITSNGLSQMDFKMQIAVVNIQNETSQHTEILGSWKAGLSNNLDLIEESIMDNYTAKPIIRIVVVLQKPFIMFDENAPKKYSGICIDILELMASLMDFEYELYTCPDGEFGNMDEEGNWNGLIRELLDRKADVGLGSISVMAERENVVDFTVPFYELVGITILMKKTKVATSLFQFLAVLENEVWICILAVFLFTSFLIWMFDRWSPYSYQNNRDKFKDDEEKREFNLKESFWFCMTSLTPQGGGVVPKNLSGILVAASWWIFGFIIIASYTANLSAFLTVSRMETPIESLDDLSKQYRIQYAPLNGSYVMEYFKRRANIESKFFEIWKDMNLNDSLSAVERSKLAVWDYPVGDKYTKMWQSMQKTGFPNTLEEAVTRVLNSKSPSDGFAYIGDGTDIRYLEATNCDLQMVGEEFSRKPYAFAIRKRSKWKEDFNTAILFFLNNKMINKVIEKWWKENPEVKHCVKDDSSPDGVSIANFGGVFIVIYIGVGLACITLAFEYWWYKHRKTAPKISLEIIAETKDSNQTEHTDSDVDVRFRRRAARISRNCETARHIKNEGVQKAWFGRPVQSC